VIDAKEHLMKKTLATAVTAVAALGAVPAGLAHPAAAPKVKVKVDEFRIIARRAVHHGRVTFVVTNAGRVGHEFVVLRTNRVASDLRRGSKASEIGHVAEIASVKPGQTQRLTVTLPAGHYSLICNLPRHYMDGMHADLRAT
jgi:uncharacterized cupredoxin-like copper-binding protein